MTRLVMTWAFVLDEVTSGVSRCSCAHVADPVTTSTHCHGALTSRIGPTCHFIMQRKQLLGIKRRAESTPADTLVSTDRSLPADQDAA